MTTLQERLDELKAESADKLTPEAKAAVKEGMNELKERQLTERALKAGDTAPGFTLPNARGSGIRSQTFLAQGPLVISFFRGKW